MSRRAKRKLHRAAYSVLTSPAGATIYVPPGQLQGVLGQVFYGSKATIPTNSTTMFSPGTPLPPQPGVNPAGKPVQFRFPIAYNTYYPERSLGQPDIPNFQQLRHLAKMDWGIGLCERKLLRMILALKLKVKLTERAVAGGAEEKQYQDEIAYFTDWFSWPDKDHGVTIHEWLQKSVIEQTQIDELYIYKNRTKGGKLLGLPVVDGAEMKPLLDDWGYTNGYQQYPWGIPGMQYPMSCMIHKRETPAAETPYGRSCVERVISITNLALRKFKQDLAHFTEGNIPAGMLMPPEGSNWTPDLIDAYEQSWNALIAGNPQQQMRIRVTQPGFTYTPFEQPSLDAVIDRFWLNIRASAYSIPMDSLGFTETSNRSTGEIQKDALYEQALYPYVRIYEEILTDIMQHDFEQSLHGDLFEIVFGGYEPPEDEQAKAQTLSTYTSAGILGLSNAAKMAGLPEEPDAPHIGRMIMTQSGPVWLDDVATPEMRQAQQQAALAGYHMAANPPDPTEQQNSNTKGDTNNATQSSGTAARDASGAGSAPRDKGTAPGSASHAATASAAVRTERALQPARDGWHAHRVQDSETRDGLHPAEFAHPDHRAESGEKLEKAGGAFIDVQRPPQDTETQESPDRAVGTTPGRDASGATQHDVVSHATAGLYPDSGQADAAKSDYRRWRQRALEDAKAGRVQRGFTSVAIPASMHGYISQLLRACRTADEVRAVFSRAQQQEREIAGSDQTLAYNAQLDIWEPEDTEQQLERMRAEGTHYLAWETHASQSGVCPVCDQNVGQVVRVGERFTSGHRLPSCHIGCQCSVKRLTEKPLERAVEPVFSVSKRGSCDCEECRAMDGKPIEDGKKPPFHEGCDCSVRED